MNKLVLPDDLPETEVIETDGVTGEPKPEPFEPEITTSQKQMDASARGKLFEGRSLYVEYTTRGPDDVVLSGPVADWDMKGSRAWGPGQWFGSRRKARAYLEAKYGAARVKGLEKQTEGRWAFLVKGLRKRVQRV